MYVHFKTFLPLHSFLPLCLHFLEFTWTHYLLSQLFSECNNRKFLSTAGVKITAGYRPKSDRTTRLAIHFCSDQSLWPAKIHAQRTAKSSCSLFVRVLNTLRFPFGKHCLRVPLLLLEHGLISTQQPFLYCTVTAACVYNYRSLGQYIK